MGGRLGYARTLPGGDADRIAVWGSSLSGGHLFKVAARDDLAAAIAQSPLAHGLASMPNALRHETIGVILRFPFLGLWDVLRGSFGRKPLVVPLAGPRGTVAMLTTPDAQDGDRALNPGNAYPQWQQAIAARSVRGLGGYRPGRAAAKVLCPLLVVVAEDDQSAPAIHAVRAAGQARRAEVDRVPGSHYAPFLSEHERTVEAESDFLDRHLRC